MMHRALLTGVIAGILLLACGAASAQGLLWEMTTAQDGGEAKHTTFSYMPGKYRVAPEGDMVSIIRLDQEKMLLVDLQRKTYHEMSFRDMEEMLKGVDAKMQQMQQQLEQLPPDQRKMVEEMMGGMHGKKPKDAVEVVEGGVTKAISGFSCSKYILKRDGKEEATIWAASDIGVPSSEWKEMWKDMEQFGKRIAALMPEGEGEVVEKSHTLIKGFPIRTMLPDGTTMTVTKVERRAVPAGEFEIPEGFTKENAPGMGGEHD